MVAQLVFMLHSSYLRDPQVDFRRRELRGAMIQRVVFEECSRYGPPHWRQHPIHTYTALPSAIELYVTDQPHPRAVIQPSAKLDKLTKFYCEMGKFRCYFVPGGLMDLHDKVAEYLGLERLIPRAPPNYHVKAYQPFGPWEYVPPDTPWDWRSRARWLIPVPPRTVSLTKLALNVSGYMPRARVTIDYQPG